MNFPIVDIDKGDKLVCDVNGDEFTCNVYYGHERLKTETLKKEMERSAQENINDRVFRFVSFEGIYDNSVDIDVNNGQVSFEVRGGDAHCVVVPQELYIDPAERVKGRLSLFCDGRKEKMENGDKLIADLRGETYVEPVPEEPKKPWWRFWT